MQQLEIEYPYEDKTIQLNVSGRDYGSLEIARVLSEVIGEDTFRILSGTHHRGSLDAYHNYQPKTVNIEVSDGYGGKIKVELGQLVLAKGE